jgi:type IV pilus assembly protein PilO
MKLDLKSKTTQKVILSGLLGVGLLALFFLTHYLPFNYPNRRDEINTFRAEYEKKSTELARARTSVADLPRFEAEYQMLHQRWAMAAELLPADRQFAALLRRITLAGQQTGVQFVMFKPNPAKTETYYTEMPVEIAVNGRYHQVGSFLAELANMRRIITVSNVHLNTNTKGADDGRTTSATLTASAYSLNNQSSPAPPAASSTKPKTEKEEANGAHQES